jgi:glycosyltransferase involved in cell wall biosynthesis
MIICHIWDADYPWDIRVEKVCQSLQLKHEVHLVCRNQKRSPRHEVLDGTIIHRLPSLPKWLDFCHEIVGLPFFFNPIWLKEIWWTVKRSRADLILVRDVPLALTAILVGRWYNVPVLLDLAENYPAMLEDQRMYSPTSFIGRIVRHPSLAKIVEKAVLGLVDHIIVVVEESRDRLVDMGIDPGRITIITNTPPLDRWSKQCAAMTASDVHDPAHFVYLGNLDGSRGLDTAIRAIRLLKDRGHYVNLSIVGTGPNIEDHRKLAETLGVTDRVAITGRLPFAKVKAIMAQATVGLIPHYGTKAWNSTIPNKLFDFMSMGKPVVVSNAKPTERIVEAVQCGIVFNERDAEALAAAMMTMEDKTLRDSFGRQGREAFVKQYNWTVDEQRLFESLDSAVRAHRGRH